VHRPSGYIGELGELGLQVLGLQRHAAWLRTEDAANKRAAPDDDDRDHGSGGYGGEGPAPGSLQATVSAVSAVSASSFHSEQALASVIEQLEVEAKEALKCTDRMVGCYFCLDRQLV
jgi:hypothetical protein